jgi:hypothetical protein
MWHVGLGLWVDICIFPYVFFFVWCYSVILVFVIQFFMVMSWIVNHKLVVISIQNAHNPYTYKLSNNISSSIVW